MEYHLQRHFVGKRHSLSECCRRVRESNLFGIHHSREFIGRRRGRWWPLFTMLRRNAVTDMHELFEQERVLFASWWRLQLRMKGCR
jgi:hypothetical protein